MCQALTTVLPIVLLIEKNERTRSDEIQWKRTERADYKRKKNEDREATDNTRTIGIVTET